MLHSCNCLNIIVIYYLLGAKVADKVCTYVGKDCRFVKIILSTIYFGDQKYTIAAA